jgi:hypothetical protein
VRDKRELPNGERGKSNIKIKCALAAKSSQLF